VLNYQKEVNMEKQQTIDGKKTSKFTKKDLPLELGEEM
jgi:hypothetical protein